MTKSIITDDKTHCFLCGKNGNSDRLERHHIYGGINRNNSEKYGLVVYLCGNECHRCGKNSVHMNKISRLILQRLSQEIAMRHYKWTESDFIRIFGKSYL